MKVIKGRCLQSENTVAQMQRLAGSLGTGIMAGFAAGKCCPPWCVVTGKKWGDAAGGDTKQLVLVRRATRTSAGEAALCSKPCVVLAVGSVTHLCGQQESCDTATHPQPAAPRHLGKSHALISLCTQW